MSRPQHRGRILAALGVAAATSVALIASTGVAPAVAKPGKPQAAKKVDLQILSFNDFHGQLEPSTSSSSGAINGVRAGGAAYLATHLDRLRDQAAAEGRHSVTVAAGDLIGATPLISAAFHDEPTIEAMNDLGLDISSVGNHEFDEGWRELVRMQEGGCIDDGPDGVDNQNSCPDHQFEGADFQYLSANVFHEDTGETVFPGTSVKTFDGVKVGFIGMTLENTPNIVTKAGIQGLRFTDEVETANAAARALQKQGVKSIVVLVHEGGFPADPTAYNSCPGISGPIVDINNGLSDKIDAVITGHTHQAYNCMLSDPSGDRRLVTSGASLGRLVTDIDLTINARSGDVIRESEVANNVIVTQTVPQDASIAQLISKYSGLVADIANEVIGSVDPSLDVLSRSADASGESPLGNLIADSQRTDPSAVTGGKTPEIAFMNPGGIRTDLAVQDDGDVTYGAAFAVQPFNNYVVSMDMTGAQILTLLEQQWGGPTNTAAKPVILQVSGITYSYRKGATANTLLPETVQVNGEAIDPARTYRVVANSFLSDGGDGLPVFAEATNKFFGGLDIDALARFLQTHTGYTPGPTDRITVAP